MTTLDAFVFHAGTNIGNHTLDLRPGLFTADSLYRRSFAGDPAITWQIAGEPHQVTVDEDEELAHLCVELDAQATMALRNQLLKRTIKGFVLRFTAEVDDWTDNRRTRTVRWADLNGATITAGQPSTRSADELGRDIEIPIRFIGLGSTDYNLRTGKTFHRASK